VNPLVLDFLREKNLPAADARSKSWDEFAVAGAPEWISSSRSAIPRPGGVPDLAGPSVTAHWGVEDPAAHMDDPAKARKLVEEAFRVLRTRISLLLALPVETLDRVAIEVKAREYGHAT
jgi:arsenate reductase